MINYKNVDAFLKNTTKWLPEIELMRSILLDCGLDESIKWGKPCYSFQNKNLIIIQPFKEYCAFGFFNGALINDTNNILVKPGQNTQEGRQIRFTTEKDIKKMEVVLKKYIYESIEVEKAGLKLDVSSKKEQIQIPELVQKFKENQALKKAFMALTPGRQRAYNMYFEAAKQPATRISRIENYTPRILNGKGFHDCVCGLSKRMPNCDGSHKVLKK